MGEEEEEEGGGGRRISGGGIEMSVNLCKTKPFKEWRTICVPFAEKKIGGVFFGMIFECQRFTMCVE